VDNWNARRQLLEAIAEPGGSSHSLKVELSIVDLLVEQHQISIGLKAQHCSRSNSFGPGDRASSLFAELHAALLPGLPRPPASSQIFRLSLVTSNTPSPSENSVHHSVETVDTLEIWRELRKERQIANGTKHGGIGLTVAGVASVTVDELVVLEMSEGDERKRKELAEFS